MAKYQVDFSGARNIIDPFEGVRNSLQQTNATLGQMIAQDAQSKDEAYRREALKLQQADKLRDEAYRRDALALQQTAAQREADKYKQELADRTFAQKAFAAYNEAPTVDYSILPAQLANTDRGKALLNEITLTPEEIANPTMPSAITKTKNQQILADEYLKSGQQMLESERFKAAMASTAKGADGMIPLSMQEKLLGMEAAERAAMTAKSERAQKMLEELSKDKSELQRAGLKDATTLSAAEIRSDSYGVGKKDKKEEKIPKATDYEATKKLLNEKYSFGPIGDKTKVAEIIATAAAAKMSPDELYGIVSGVEERGIIDNTFDKEKALLGILAKKPVLTGDAGTGSPARTAGRFASLDPMTGYAELLKQKEAAYKQAAVNAINMPLTQADVIAARNAKGATQLDELIAKLGATTSKAEVNPEVKPEIMDIPVSVPTEVKQKEVNINELFANVPDYPLNNMNKQEVSIMPKPIYNALGEIIGKEKTKEQVITNTVLQKDPLYRELKRQYPNLSDERILERWKLLQ